MVVVLNGYVGATSLEKEEQKIQVGNEEIYDR